MPDIVYLHGFASSSDSEKGRFFHNQFGMIGTTISPVVYVELPGAREEQLGHQLMISFWAWGDAESEVMRNLKRVLENLSQALGSLATAA